MGGTISAEFGPKAELVSDDDFSRLLCMAEQSNPKRFRKLVQKADAFIKARDFGVDDEKSRENIDVSIDLRLEEVKEAQAAIGFKHTLLHDIEMAIVEAQACYDVSPSWLRDGWVGMEDQARAMTTGGVLKKYKQTRENLAQDLAKLEANYVELRANATSQVSGLLHETSVKYSKKMEELLNEGDEKACLAEVDEIAKAVNGQQSRGKVVQNISADAIARVSGGDPDIKRACEDPTDVRFLLAMYHDAPSALQWLVSVAESVKKNIKTSHNIEVRVVEGPLKGVPRAITKTKEKYRLSFSKVKDIVRATIECNTLREVLIVMKELQKLPGVEILFIKNRFSAQVEDLAGGYRDALVNVRQVDGTGHICELQIHINAMLAVKSKGGGHVAYKAARFLQVFNDDISMYFGKAVPLSEDKSARSALVRLSKGQLKAWDFSLTKMSAELARDMAQALAAPSCKVIKMIAHISEWDSGVKMEDVYNEDVCSNIAYSLEHINISNASKNLKGSSFTPHLSLLNNLVVLEANYTGFAEPQFHVLMEWLQGSAHSIKDLQLMCNTLGGHFPSGDIMKRFISLEKINLEGVGLKGDIPKYLDNCCPNLRQLKLKHNPELGGRDAVGSINETRSSTQHPDDSSKYMAAIEYDLE